MSKRRQRALTAAFHAVTGRDPSRTIWKPEGFYRSEWRLVKRAGRRGYSVPHLAVAPIEGASFRQARIVLEEMRLLSRSSKRAARFYRYAAGETAEVARG
jgi:hypothetical protein